MQYKLEANPPCKFPYIQVEVSLLHERCSELQHLALHYSHICSLLDHARATLRCMHGAWEDLLLMVDAKLARYSTVSSELHFTEIDKNLNTIHHLHFACVYLLTFCL